MSIIMVSSLYHGDLASRGVHGTSATAVTVVEQVLCLAFCLLVLICMCAFWRARRGDQGEMARTAGLLKLEFLTLWYR